MLVANASKYETLLLDTLRAKVLELCETQVIIHQWLVSICELLASSNVDFGTLRQTLGMLIDCFDAIVSTHGPEDGSLTADLQKR